MAPHTAALLVEGTGALAAAGRLWWLGLARRFQALFGYLAFLAVGDLTASPLKSNSTAYYHAYLVIESLKCILGIFAVRELFTLIFENYPGIQTIGRWVMYTGIALSICMSTAITLWSGGPQRRPPLFYVELCGRWIVFALAIVICSMLVCLSRYPLRLRTNTIIGSVLFSALFLSEACQLLIDSIAPHFYNHLVDWSESFIAGLCLSLWAVLLKRNDEPVLERVALPESREGHLLQQLNALNQVMARAARR